MSRFYVGALVVLNPAITSGNTPLVVGEVVFVSDHHFTVQWSNSPVVFSYLTQEADLIREL